MPPAIPSCEPDAFAAGETVQWQRTITDYLASDGWTPKYYFAGPATFTIAGSASGNGWLFTALPAATAAIAAGTYTWHLYVEQGSPVTDRRRIRNGVVEVTRNIVTAAAGDFQSHEEKTLSVIELALQKRLPADLEAYTIDGRSVTKIPIKELEGLRIRYAWAVYRQKNPGKIGAPVGVAFFPPDGVVGAPEPIVLPPWFNQRGGG